jgi:hypothetical protein
MVYAELRDKKDIVEVYELLERVDSIAERAIIAAGMGSVRDSLKYLRQCFEDPKAGTYFLGDPKEAHKRLEGLGLKMPHDQFMAGLSDPDGLELLISEGVYFKAVTEKGRVRVIQLGIAGAFTDLSSLCKKIISETSGIPATEDAIACRDMRLLRAVGRLFPGKASYAASLWLAANS